MATLKAAYLIHGDDHGAIAERRAGLRALAEGADGAGASVELLEGDAATPAGVAQVLATLTLGMGAPDAGGVGRVIIVEGVERWRAADVELHLAPALEAMQPQTTLALFAREDTRAKAPSGVHEAVKRAGGQVSAQMTVKPWELVKWAREQAARMGLSLDAAAAKTLVNQVGERQQRLLRELEKLALEGEPAAQPSEPPAASPPASPAAAPGEASSRGPGGGPRQVSAEDIEQRAAHSAELRAYGLADALVAADAREAVRFYLRLRQQGERLSGLTYLMAQRLRDALSVALRLRDGEPVAEIKRGLRMPARAAERFVADVAANDPERLRAALGALADLELDSRGGSPLPAGRVAGRRSLAGLEEDTLAVRAIEAITR
jgi:DNA polymerase-3 subunit delta